MFSRRSTPKHTWAGELGSPTPHPQAKFSLSTVALGLSRAACQAGTTQPRCPAQRRSIWRVALAAAQRTGGPHPKRRRPTHPDPPLLPRVGLAPPTPPFVQDNLGPLPWVLDTLPSLPPVASPAGLWPTQASLPPSPKRTHLAHKGQPGRKGARGAGFS